MADTFKHETLSERQRRFQHELAAERARSQGLEEALRWLKRDVLNHLDGKSVRNFDETLSYVDSVLSTAPGAVEEPTDIGKDGLPHMKHPSKEAIEAGCDCWDCVG